MDVAVVPTEALTGAATRRSVLLVEDDEAFRYAVKTALRKAGFDVVAVADTMKALKVLDGGSTVDLLVTDILMPPRMPYGFALARMARRQRHGLRVLFVTGYDGILDDELDGGAVLLHKPVELDALVDAVKLGLKSGR